MTDEGPRADATRNFGIVSFAETSSGELTRKLAGKISTVSSLKQNYAVLAKFTDSAPENEVRIFSTKLMDQLLHYPTSNWYHRDTYGSFKRL